MARYLDTATTAAKWLLVLGLAAVVLAAIWPRGETLGTVEQLLPIVAMLAIAIGAVVWVFGAAAEIAVSKNEGGWKAIWILVVLIFGVFGTALYMIAARKDLKE